MKLLQGMMKKEKLVVILLLGLLLLIAALPVKEREVPQMLSEEENGTDRKKNKRTGSSRWKNSWKRYWKR